MPLVFIAFLPRAAAAASVADAQKLFESGKYSECIALCSKAIDGNDWAESWWRLELGAQLATGKYAEALKTYEAALARQPQSIQVRLLGIDVLRLNDRAPEAASLPETIAQMVANDPSGYYGAADHAAVARAVLIGGADARQVLERLLDPPRKQYPDAVEPYLASGDLALEKDDFAVAAESFEAAAKHAPNNPDVYYGLARAYQDDAKRASESLAKALELNPRHVNSLLMQADNLVDREAYDEARTILSTVLTINPREARAWAYLAVLAELIGDHAAAKSARSEALASWSTNPEVDHLIGKKLSQKYRFTDGQRYQRQSLTFNARYEPAKVQLCQDLLRLGQEDQGWQLADEVFKEDPYNVLAFNLTTLRDNLSKYHVDESPHFLVRMDPREQQIYGSRVDGLLERARKTLCAKYDVELHDPTIVEIFPQLKDFAIRTFGMPGGSGYLGVCFGRVITANSPASRPGHPADWEAILWHEFCHVITLNKTHNKMPRWLSEGISVYEESQENPAWGQKMNPQYREIILAHGETPVSQLSGAFLRSTDFLQLQFAYFESSMVVRYVVETFGMPALKDVLTDLGNDVPINDALTRHTESIEKLDAHFAKWLLEQANHLAPDVDWERPDAPLDAGSAPLVAWVKDHPNSFWGLLGLGQSLIAEQKWQEAKVPLEKAAKLYPGYAEVGGPYALLAAASHGLNDTDAEQAMLAKQASLNADAVEVRLRLLEILEGKKDWKSARSVAEQVIAVNPLIASPHRYLANAAEALGDGPVAIGAERTLLLLNPLDLADRHYRLAKLLADAGQLPEARKEVVRSLEDAPRFRDAHKLLLSIVSRMPPPATVPATQEAP